MRYRPWVLWLCRWCSNACGELSGWPCLCHMPCFVPFPRFYCASLIDISLWSFLAGDVLGFSLGCHLIFYLLGGCCGPFLLRIIRRPVPNQWLVCWPTFARVYLLAFVCTQKVFFFFFWFFGCPFLCILLAGLRPVDFWPSCYVVRQILECVQHIENENFVPLFDE